MSKLWRTVALVLVAACSGNHDPESLPTTSGSSGGPAAGAAGRESSQGGSSAVAGKSGAAAGGSGAVATAGSANTDVAGRPAAAGSGSAGRAGSGGAGVSGGPAAAGAGGMIAGAEHAGASGGVAPVGAMPSAGCMKASGRPPGGVVMQSDRIYDFPASYDGKTPLPFLLALHAAGNPNTQLQNLTKGSKLETDFVRAFPKSAGSAWVYNTDSSKLNAVIEDVLSNYCVDTSRMFATGHSSGAQMVVQMLCNGEKRFKAVAPVAASKYCAKLSPVPVLYIQGMMDAQRGGGNGMDVVDVFTTSNGCSTSKSPKTDVASCTSSFDKMQVVPGCVSFEGCSAPTLWCSHNDNGYNNTDGRQHGWPCFASSAIAAFFLSL